MLLVFLVSMAVVFAEEDWSAEKSSVVHFKTEKEFNKFVKKNDNVLTMFYAPWCGHCKSLKPTFTEAANTVAQDKKAAGEGKKAPGFFGAVDCTQMQDLCKSHDITGYPTLKMFSNKGEDIVNYERPRSLSELVKFVRPESASGDKKVADSGATPAATKKDEGLWADTPSDVSHLTADNFDTFVAENKNVLLMFYAPWCGHCKNLKPAYTEAATKVKAAGSGHLAAVDCTQHQSVCSKFEVAGYPTLKYFKDGKVSADYNRPRTVDALVEFMADPKAAPAAAPAAAAAAPADKKAEEKKEADKWTHAGSEHVSFLTDETFGDFIKTNPHVLVMFYAPWCGHCKNMKPAYAEAAAKLAGEGHKNTLAAVDCTVAAALCQEHGIKGYPTLKHFNNGVATEDKPSARTLDSLVSFIKGKLGLAADVPAAAAAAAAGVAADVKAEVKKEADKWTHAGSEHVKFLSEDSFDDHIKANPNVLTMFYAPWCGHCKNMKPAYAEAAAKLAGEGHAGSLAAVDCTVDSALCQKYGVRGYPTLKHFGSGVETEDKPAGRSLDNLFDFIKGKAAKVVEAVEAAATGLKEEL